MDKNGGREQKLLVETLFPELKEQIRGFAETPNSSGLGGSKGFLRPRGSQGSLCTQSILRKFKSTAELKYQETLQRFEGRFLKENASDLQRINGVLEGKKRALEESSQMLGVTTTDITRRLETVAGKRKVTQETTKELEEKLAQEIKNTENIGVRRAEVELKKAQAQQRLREVEDRLAQGRVRAVEMAGHIEAATIKNDLLTARLEALEAKASESKQKVHLKKERLVRAESSLREAEEQLESERGNHHSVGEQTRELEETIGREREALAVLKSERTALEELEREFWGLRVTYAERLSDWLL